MSSRSDVIEMIVYASCFLPVIIIFVGFCFWCGTNKVTETVPNTVTNEAVNNTTIVTETEVYKVVCTEPVDGYCKEYSVRRLNKE